MPSRPPPSCPHPDSRAREREVPRHAGALLGQTHAHATTPLAPALPSTHRAGSGRRLGSSCHGRYSHPSTTTSPLCSPPSASTRSPRASNRNRYFPAPYARCHRPCDPPSRSGRPPASRALPWKPEQPGSRVRTPMLSCNAAQGVRPSQFPAPAQASQVHRGDRFEEPRRNGPFHAKRDARCHHPVPQAGYARRASPTWWRPTKTRHSTALPPAANPDASRRGPTADSERSPPRRSRGTRRFRNRSGPGVGNR